MNSHSWWSVHACFGSQDQDLDIGFPHVQSVTVPGGKKYLLLSASGLKSAPHCSARNLSGVEPSRHTTRTLQYPQGHHNYLMTTIYRSWSLYCQFPTKHLDQRGGSCPQHVVHKFLYHHLPGQESHLRMQISASLMLSHISRRPPILISNSDISASCICVPYCYPNGV